MPLPLRFPVMDGLPLDETLVAGGVMVTLNGAEISLQTPGSRARKLRLKDGKRATLRIGPKGAERAVAFFQLLGETYAAPASVLVISIKNKLKKHRHFF